MTETIDIGNGTKLQVGGSELGTSFSFDDLLFAGWQDGLVFEYEEWRARDMLAFLDKDGQATKLEQLLTLPVRMAPWAIEGAKGDKGEAEYLTEVLTRPANGGGMSTTMSEIIGQATSARMVRKAFFEKVFKIDPRNPGKVMYDKIAFRPAQTCALLRDERTAAFRGFLQRPIFIGTAQRPKTKLIDIKIDPQYAFVHINGRHRNPLRGISDMEVAYWCHQTKLKILFLWATFAETQAAPRTVVTDQDETTAASNARKVAKLKNGGVVGLRTGTEVNTLESNGGGTASQIFRDMIAYLDTQMSGSVLANFSDLATAATGAGSYALSGDQSDFFLQASNAYATSLAEDISNYLIADLVTYNFGPDAAFPQFKFGPLSEGDLTPIKEILSTLATAQNQVLPFEFIDELALKTAAYLDLDVDRVRDAMGKAGDRAEEKAQMAMDSQKLGVEGQKKAQDEPPAAAVARTAAAVNTAVKAVKQGGPAAAKPATK